MRNTVFYTAITPTDAVVTVICRDRDAALDLAQRDLQRDWVPATITAGQRKWDIDAITAQLAQRAQPAEALPCPS